MLQLGKFVCLFFSFLDHLKTGYHQLRALVMAYGDITPDSPLSLSSSSSSSSSSSPSSSPSSSSTFTSAADQSSHLQTEEERETPFDKFGVSNQK